MPLSRRVIFLSLTALALAALGWLLKPARTASVVLITVDTLRADHLGCYGSRTTRTPNIDRLATAGLLFENAVVPLPETRPAHRTLFTSRYPRDHGVLSNASRLVPGSTTLPAVFSQAGYATGGFPSCSLFSAAVGAELGFSHFETFEASELGAHEVVPNALRWLAGLDRERPFFMWLHLFDPHLPYEPPPPFGVGSSARMTQTYPRLGWTELLEVAADNDGDLPRPVLERARELYRGEVELVDHWLGRFFTELETSGRLDETIVLLTSDHGECFENGVFFEHSNCLGEGALAAPLILRYPESIEPGRVSTAVEHLDVAPTLLRLADLPVPASFRGHGLLKRMEIDAPYVFFQYPVYPRWEARQRRGWFAALRSVAGEPVEPLVTDQLQIGARRGPWKYLLRGSRETLFNLVEDPEERVDLAARNPERLVELRRAVRRWHREHPFELRFTDDLDPELLKQLRVLGYL